MFWKMKIEVAVLCSQIKESVESVTNNLIKLSVKNLSFNY